MYSSNRRHGVTNQKAAIFTSTSARTLNLVASSRWTGKLSSLGELQKHGAQTEWTGRREKWKGWRSRRGGIGGFVLAKSGLRDRPVSSTAIARFGWQPSQHRELVQTDCFKSTCVVTNYCEGEIWITHCGVAKHCVLLVSDTRVFPDVVPSAIFRQDEVRCRKLK
jgi:hypothetical protein